MADKNFPFDDVAKSCEALMRKGGFFVQKWTCDGCRQRIASPNVNVFTETGHCAHCNTVTDMRKTGCNFAAILSPGSTIEQVQAIVTAAYHKVPTTFDGGGSTH